MMRITWDSGLEELDNFLEQAPKQVVQAVATEMYQEAESMMTLSQSRFVPVRDGILRGSGHVKRPKISNWRIIVELGYGGAAAAYAVIQHEAMHFRHTVGGPKYLERPVKQRTPQLVEAMTAAVRKGTK